MEEEHYGIIEVKEPQFPVRKLLRVPHKNRVLVVGYPAFGPSTYNSNKQAMQKDYSHIQTGEKISFRPATTSESISAVAYDFQKLAKPEIFDPKWLQAGYIIRTQDGVFTNTTETNETKLKQLLNKAEKINGIYLGENDFGFAPYESFERGIQDCDKFSQGGLARALEHTPKKMAKNLREISSPKFYKNGINVWAFDKVKDPTLKVASLYSGMVDDGLLVCGYYWGGYFGCGFGVLK